MSNRRFALTCLCGITVVSALLYVNRQGWFDQADEAPQVAENVDSKQATEGSAAADGRDPRWLKALDVKENNLKTVGDVVRPARDVDFGGGDSTSPSPGAEDEYVSPFTFPGKSPSLKGDENAQVAGLLKELQDPEGPQAAKSTFFEPEPFDLAIHEADPQAYLDLIRPARSFYPAQPGPDAIPLRAESNKFSHIVQGESAILRVKASPKAPVAFYHSGVGRFENNLKSITVAADKDGIAEVRYVAGLGVTDLNTVLAASPLHSQQLKFTIKVDLPQ